MATSLFRPDSGEERSVLAVPGFNPENRLHFPSSSADDEATRFRFSLSSADDGINRNLDALLSADNEINRPPGHAVVG
jgi:hypothetical protein